MSRFVFLDFDGVLNGRSYLDRTASTLTDSEYLTQSSELLDPDAVRRLDELVARTGSRVVVSSTWRIRRTVEELQAILRSRGFKGIVAGKTAEGMLDKTRGAEIARWLSENRESHAQFCVLDDDPSVAVFRDHHVLVNADLGLTDEDCRCAAEILVAGPVQPIGEANLLAEWRDFIHFVEPGRIRTKAERFDLSLVTQGGWVMTEEYVAGFGDDDRFEAMRVDARGDVSIWTLYRSWGIVRHPRGLERFKCVLRDPALRPTPDPTATDDPSFLSSDWRDFVIFPEGCPGFASVPRALRFDLSLVTRGATAVRKETIVPEGDEFERMRADACGNVTIWTKRRVICLIGNGGTEAMIPFIRHPYD